MQDMLACVFTLQICCFMTFYQSALPANAGIYLDQFRELIEFKLLGPDPILKMINKDWSVAYFRGLK